MQMDIIGEIGALDILLKECEDSFKETIPNWGALDWRDRLELLNSEAKKEHRQMFFDKYIGNRLEVLKDELISYFENSTLLQRRELWNCMKETKQLSNFFDTDFQNEDEFRKTMMLQLVSNIHSDVRDEIMSLSAILKRTTTVGIPLDHVESIIASILPLADNDWDEDYLADWKKSENYGQEGYYSLSGPMFHILTACFGFKENR